MYKITNCVNDRSKEHLRRVASKVTWEPSIGGERLRIGASMELDDAHFESIRGLLEGFEAKGIVTIEKIGGESAPVEAPTETPPAPEPTTTEEPGAGATTVEMSSETKVEDTAPTETIKKGPGKKKLF